MTGKLGNDVSGETDDSLAHQMLKVAASVLQLVESAFNALTQGIEPAVELDRILNFLVGPFGRPYLITTPVRC